MPDLKLTDEHNTRMPKIWAAIETAVEIEGKRVIDLGCGGGDLVRRCHLAGAKHVLGIDRDPDLVFGRKKTWKGVVRGVVLAEMNINALVARNHQWDPPFDIAFCMSVLPYLRPWQDALRWIHATFDLAVIECQYWTDGPGPAEIRDAGDMKYLLQQHWDRVDLIGASYVVDSGAARDIWRCIKIDD